MPRGRLADMHALTVELPAPGRRIGSTEMPVMLIVDDNEQLREMTAEILQSIGYKVLTTGSGREALEEWESNHERIDIVMTDVNLGGDMDGPVLACRLRETRPALPIVFTSGDGIGELACGINFHYLQKPYSLSLLLKTLYLACAANEVRSESDA